jgi:hypothetical protein
VDALTIRSGGDWRATAWDSVGTAALKIPAAYYHLTMPR